MQSHAVVVVVCVRVCGGVFLTNVRIPAPLACERSPAKLGILLLLLCPIGSSFLCSHELSSCAFVCVCVHPLIIAHACNFVALSLKIQRAPVMQWNVLLRGTEKWR